MTRTIPLTRGYVATVDDEDYAYLSRFNWCANVYRHTVYAYRKFRKHERAEGRTTTGVLMHREIMDVFSNDLEVDHVDHDGLNNRRSNLRVCTKLQNIANTRRHAPGASTFKGVGWNKRRGMWRSRIRNGGRERHLGFFSDEVNAALAYDQAARSEFGVFAFLNFPEVIEYPSSLVRTKSSNFRGVSWKPKVQKWQVTVYVNRKGIYVGRFDSEIDAARAYDDAATQYLGELARPNFPGGA